MQSRCLRFHDHPIAAIRRLGAVATLAVGLSACGILKVGPDYEPPEPNIPDQWNLEATKGLSEGTANLRTWWVTFNDPQLDSLIERAAQGNLDLRVAFSRIRESRARLGVASGDQFPDFDAVGDVERSRLSEGTNATPPAPQSRTDTLRQVGIDSSWEIDLFGRIARNIESADADLEATIEDYRDTLVLLYAEVALTYAEVRALQARIRFANNNVEAQRGSLQVAQDRFDAQLVPELDVRQAQLNLATTQATVPALKADLAGEINRLSVLLGEHPRSLHAELRVEAPVPAAPGTLMVGLPRELVRQRPDIRRAERDLAAQTAQIGVATADLYPRFSLTGSFAFSTTQGDLFDSRNRAWAFGPAVRWNIFDGGRVRNNILLEDARTKTSVITYEQTVLNALEDVESSISAYANEKDRRDSLERSVIAARRSVFLVDDLYRQGLTDFQNVFDSQRRLAEQEDALAESEGQVMQELVRVYRALGGGWQPQPKPLDAEIEDIKTKGQPIF